MVTEINETEFNNKINETCIVDFYATWCPPCKMLSPVIEKVSEEYGSKLNFHKLNVDENNSISERYQIMAVPTIVIFKNGNVANRVSGYMGEKQLIEFINKSL